MNLKKVDVKKSAIDQLLAKNPADVRLKSVYKLLTEYIDLPIIDLPLVFSAAGAMEGPIPFPAIAVGSPNARIVEVYYNEEDTSFGDEDEILEEDILYKLPTNSWHPSITDLKRHDSFSAKASVPVIPSVLVEQIGKKEIDESLILFEPIWEINIPDPDPYLIKRIENSDLFAILGSWDLTPLEMEVMRAGLL